MDLSIEQIKELFKIQLEISKNGYIEFSDGVYINSSENLNAEQTEWNDSDNSKNIDFTFYNYWITTNDGIDPVPFMSLGDCVSYLKDQGL